MGIKVVEDVNKTTAVGTAAPSKTEETRKVKRANTIQLNRVKYVARKGAPKGEVMNRSRAEMFNKYRARKGGDGAEADECDNICSSALLSCGLTGFECSSRGCYFIILGNKVDNAMPCICATGGCCCCIWPCWAEAVHGCCGSRFGD